MRGVMVLHPDSVTHGGGTAVLQRTVCKIRAGEEEAESGEG